MEWVIFWMLCGVVSAVIGHAKGGNVGLAFVLGLILGPFGILLALFTTGVSCGWRARRGGLLCNHS